MSPTSALDPLNKALFVEIIEEFIAEGRGIIMATHDNSLVEMLQAGVLLLEEGSLRAPCVTTDNC